MPKDAVDSVGDLPYAWKKLSHLANEASDSLSALQALSRASYCSLPQKMSLSQEMLLWQPLLGVTTAQLGNRGSPARFMSYCNVKIATPYI